MSFAVSYRSLWGQRLYHQIAVLWYQRLLHVDGEDWVLCCMLLIFSLRKSLKWNEETHVKKHKPWAPHLPRVLGRLWKRALTTCTCSLSFLSNLCKHKVFLHCLIKDSLTVAQALGSENLDLSLSLYTANCRVLSHIFPMRGWHAFVLLVCVCAWARVCSLFFVYRMGI